MTGRCLVVSAVNFTEGGPLTVLRDFVDAACTVLPAEWEIVVFLHDSALITHNRPRLIAIPYARSSWSRRLRVEWFEFRGYARKLRPDLWVSLHDISPNVGDCPQAVYCHNPSCFFRLGWRDGLFEPSLLVFQWAYGFLYRIRLKRNRAVIVQQEWLRERFRRWVGDSTQIVVAYPAVPTVEQRRQPQMRRHPGPATFLYPALPRAFKNFELICRAIQQLESHCDWNSTVILTLTGTENRYARWLHRQFSSLRTVRFVGRQTREQMKELYASADCLIFPSRMETWGLPISEAKAANMPMFVADLAYSRETVGSYGAVDFIDPYDPRALADKLLAFQSGAFNFEATVRSAPAEPFVRDWPSLIRLLAGLAVNTTAGCAGGP
jgi:glycosyltransferase involved in cell wall biosynthesis